MDLAVPVAHWLCIDKINKILRCVCFTCGALLVDRKDPKIIRRFSRYQKSKTNRLTVISTFCKGRTCIASHDGVVCGAPQPVYGRSGPYLTCTFPEGTVFESEEEEKWSRRKFTAAIARDILSNISDEDCEFIGLNPKQTRPEWLILVTISVPPPLIRPTTSISDGSRTKGHDDLTSLLREISKYNMKLKELQKQYAERVQQGSVTPEYEKEYQKLFDLNKHELVVQLAVYFDKDGGAGTSQMSLGGTGVMRNTRSRQHLRNGPLRSLGKRMGGKKGRIRTSVLGKRVDHCARSVITPDPFVDIHELVVPQIVVRNQTLPETVNRLNIADLKRRVCRGFHRDGGGVLKIQRPNGSEINLDILRDKPEDLARISKALLPGWVVHRQVKNGDWCVFNRQPTLHKMGMMGHKIRIIPTDPSVFHGIQCTFGLPVPTTSPYNADYDGDEMNLHLPQNFASQSETKHLMAVPFQILSPKDSKPCMGAVQDSVIGSFKLTSKDTFLTRPDFFEYMMCSKYADDPRAPPPAIFYRNDRGEWDVLFTGKQLASYITPKGITFTRKTRGLDEGGMSACMDVEERFVVFQNGTLLAGQLDKQTVGSVNRGIMHRTCIQHGPWRACYWVSDLQRIACKFIGHYGFSIGMVDCLHSSATQKRIDNVIDASISAVIEGGKRAEEAGVDPNRIEGEKMRVLQNVLNDTARIVLESVKHDNVIWECITSGSKGKKLNYTQIHALVSQQSVSGQRLKYRTDPEARSLPCFDDSDKDHPFARGFCANSYLKGLTPVEMFFHCAGGREGMIDTACKTAETGYLQRRMGKILESEHACADTSVRDSHGHIIVRRYGGDGMACEKLLKTTIRILGKKGTAADLARRWCGGISVESEALETSITDVRACLIMFTTTSTSSTLYLPFDPNDHIPPPSDTAWDPVSCRNIVAATERAIVSIVGHEESCGPMFLALRSTYVSSRLRGATAEALQECLDEIVAYVRGARVQNGDMLGIIAAQSIGEPATQMTLNTFHTAGTGNKTVQRGVPRFKEIIDCAKRLKTPSMDIYLAPPVEGSLGIAKKLTRQLTEYRLSDFVMAYDILYEPIVNETDIPGDRNAVRAYYDVSGLPKDFCLYVSRIVIDKQKLIKKYLCIDQICNAVRYHVKEKGEVMSTTYADDEWVVRVRLCKMSSFSKINHSGVENDSLEIHHAIAHEFCDGIIDDVRISGLAGVEAYVAGYIGICLETNEPLSNKYMVETSGSHLRKILSSGNLIDSTRTVSNDVNEILKCLGVEAAQTVIFKETLDVLCDGGDSMAPHHLWLLSMKMTFTGEAQPVTRHGMIKTGQTTIVKASFERTVDTFIDAAVHGVRDECRGVTESIVTGRLAPVGTGCNIDIYEIHGNTTTKKDVEKKKETTICDEEFIGRRKRRWREEETHPPIYDWITCPRERFKLNRLRNTNRTTTPPPDIMFDTECSMNWNTVPVTPPMISEDGPNTPPEDFEPQTPPCTPTVSENEEGDDDEITDTSPLYVPSSPISTNKDIDKKNTWTVTLGSPHYVSNFNVSEWEVRLESPTKNP